MDKQVLIFFNGIAFKIIDSARRIFAAASYIVYLVGQSSIALVGGYLFVVYNYYFLVWNRLD